MRKARGAMVYFASPTSFLGSFLVPLDFWPARPIEPQLLSVSPGNDSSQSLLALELLLSRNLLTSRAIYSVALLAFFLTSSFAGSSVTPRHQRHDQKLCVNNYRSLKAAASLPVPLLALLRSVLPCSGRHKNWPFFTNDLTCDSLHQHTFETNLRVFAPFERDI
ncbi:hypothetical protein B0J14DRAFT_21772 [Halenospora varia]|nr:hypothetical protein B0J14DRAFT_21772 [Halenospora varia]